MKYVMLLSLILNAGLGYMMAVTYPSQMKETLELYAQCRTDLLTLEVTAIYELNEMHSQLQNCAAREQLAFLELQEGKLEKTKCAILYKEETGKDYEQ